MTSEDSQNDTAGDDTAVVDTEAIDTADDRTVVLQKSDAATTQVVSSTVPAAGGVPMSGVTAKARAKAQAREEAPDRQLTVSVRSLKKIAAGVAGAAIIAGVAFGGWTLYDTKRELAAFDDSRTAASEFVTKYFEVVLAQGKTVDDIKSTVLPLTTGAMHDRVEKDSQSAVDFTKETKIENFTSKITLASVESFDRDRSVVVIAAEFSGTSATAPTGGKNLMLLQIDLENVDGAWLVSNLDVAPGVPTDQSAPSTPASAPTAPPGG